MATDPSTVDSLLDQIHRVGTITARRMFGEYALYCDSKVVALIFDDQLFVKPTKAGRTYLETPAEAQPFPGARGWFLITGDRWEDSDWLSELIRLTAAELPLPKPKSAKRKKLTKAS